MKYNVKFIFYLKSGKTFECIEELTEELFKDMALAIKTSMTEDVSGSLFFSSCCVRLSECAVVDWEVLNG